MSEHDLADIAARESGGWEGEKTEAEELDDALRGALSVSPDRVARVREGVRVRVGVEAGEFDRALRSVLEVSPGRVGRVRDVVRGRIEGEATSEFRARRGRLRWWAVAAAVLVAGVGAGRAVWLRLEVTSEQRVASRPVGAPEVVPGKGLSVVGGEGILHRELAPEDKGLEAASALLRVAFEDAVRRGG